MNKTEMIKSVAETAGVTQIVAEKCVKGVFESMTTALHEGDKVSVMGFGVFSVKDRAERVGHNPQTGEEMTIPAHKSVSFKAGKGLKACVND